MSVMLFIAMLVLAGCATSAPRRVTSTTDRWAAFEILPPSIVQNALQGQTIILIMGSRSRIEVLG